MEFGHSLPDLVPKTVDGEPEPQELVAVLHCDPDVRPLDDTELGHPAGVVIDEPIGYRRRLATRA